jgi:Malectin domain
MRFSHHCSFRFSFTFPRSRIFDIIVEDKVITDIDIVQQAGGSAFRAITRETPVTVTDGFLSIKFAPKEPAIGDPKVSQEIEETA